MVSDPILPARGAEFAGSSTRNANRTPRLVLLGVALFAFAGACFALWLRGVAAGTQDARLFRNVFYVLFARNEPLGLSLVALFSIGAAFLIFRKRNAPETTASQNSHASNALAVVAIAVAVLAVTALGTLYVCHDHALTADENMADFQAKIFLRGKVLAELPPGWSAVGSVTPMYVDYFPETRSWKSTYLPVYAALRAVFQSVDLQFLLNPFLAAITVLALYGTARKIWPESQPNAIAAIALLASSSQFLVMAMTAYAMPAHLALNTCWLWLYSDPSRRRFYLAPVIGALAIGLHQPIVHALFAAPFLLRLVLQRRWRAVFIFGVIYLAACSAWAMWRLHYLAPSVASEGPREAILRLWNPRMFIVQPMSLLLLIGWTSLAVPLLAAVGFHRFFKLQPMLQDAAVSCLLTFGFYYFFYSDQAHGWGYRYFHGTLSCLVLVAIAGWNALSARTGTHASRLFLAAGVAASILIMLPLRCFQAETFTRPFARAAAAIAAMPNPVVALDGRDCWYCYDLIRNDPFLEQPPIVISLSRLTPESVAALEKTPGVQFLDRAALAHFGLVTKRDTQFKHDPFELGLGK